MKDMGKEKVRVMYSEEEVARRVAALAEQLNMDYAGKELRVICVLKGSVIFFSELVKRLSIPVTIDFLAVSSYGNGVDSSGTLTMKKDLDESIKGVDCLLVEDIVDTGRTLAGMKELLLEREPASLKICTLLDKPERREIAVDADYVGFQIPDEFVVGYGLDYAQRYRNLPYIGILEFV